jgi:intein-encoded DNA endonuclease-like protein
MKKTLDRQTIIDLYESGMNVPQIRDHLNLNHHQPILNILNTYDGYIPYKYGRNPSRKYHFDEHYLDNIDNEYKAYILGFICADGHVSTDSNRVKIAVATKDEDIIIKIKSCFQTDSPIVRTTIDSKFSYGKRIFYKSSLELCSKITVESLVNKSLEQRKTYSLSSKVLEFVPTELVRHFLRGYFDGDGNVMYGYRYSSGVKYCINICGNLEFLQNTFGIYFPTKNKYYLNKGSKQCYSYKVSSKKGVELFLSYLYDDCNIYLDRKYSIYKIACGHLKSEELLESYGENYADQQPSLFIQEGSETIPKGSTLK